MATIIKYPNASAGRVNPVNGTNNVIVNVNITSDYYKSWADYARTLSYTNVSVNDKNKTAIIVLEVLSPMGTFVSIPSEITMRNINMSNPEPLVNFSFSLANPGVSWGAREFKLVAINGDKTISIKIDKQSTDIYIEYSYEAPGISEEWKALLFDFKTDSPWNIDLLNKTLNLTFTSASCPNCTWSPSPTGSTKYSLYNITQHYALLIGPDIVFDIDSSKMNIVTSSYTLYYDPGPGALTYLHVTENKADVGIS
jgi:hypothetical protein